MSKYKTPPAVVSLLKRHSKKLKVASDLLAMRHKARGGGLIEKVLFLVSAVELVTEAVYPTFGAYQELARLDHKPLNLPSGAFICELLHKSPIEKVFIDLDVRGGPATTRKLVFWPTLEMSAVCEDRRVSEGPFGTEQAVTLVSKAVQDIVWKMGNDLILADNGQSVPDWDDYSSRFGLGNLPPPGKYVGDREVSWYASRVSAHGKDTTRSVLLIGPSGAGKSVLARLVAREVSGGQARTLKISSKVLKGRSITDVVSIVETIKPTVLLLDDCDLSDSIKTEDFLALLEAARQPGCVVFVTMMSDTVQDRTRRGSVCFPGMRPGRIDECFVIDYPDAQLRERILLEYLQGVEVPPGLCSEIAAATERLTGAYLRELANRICVFGHETWKEELSQVLVTAPKLEDEQ